jgi:hypothetical protein
MTELVRKFLQKMKGERRFCQKKGRMKNSDCEVVINAKERPGVCFIENV